MTPEEQTRFSDNTTKVALPVNFLECVQEISPDALLTLLAFFQMMSQQEEESQIALAFDLRQALPGHLRKNEDRLVAALTELHNAHLLYSLNDPTNMQKTYLVAGTPSGTAIYEQLCQDPEQIMLYKLARQLPTLERPNIFKLYEENIGALTPMIAETLKADMQLYPLEWIEDAMKEAVTYNARNWKYVQAILRNWQEKGRKRSNEETKRDHDQFRKLYLEQKRDYNGG
ncbi:MAG: DnaD domain protein [Chloroflexi bacterium]|nr:DnaD domain protein [Chloroflexota bacterium]